jgi:hypothetical protein
MAAKRFVDPFELMIRRADLSRLLKFFMRLEERLSSAFPRSARVMAESNSPSAKQVRGSTRRHYLHQALESSAADTKYPCQTRWTQPASWSYPVVGLGGFSLTVGITETKYRGASRTLRSRSQYLKELCVRNEIANPQIPLFEQFDPKDAVIPDGALGGLIVAQYSSGQPTYPAFLGFWVPSPDLTKAHYVRSLDEIIAMLRERLSMSRRPTKKLVERKPLRRRKPGSRKP